MKSGLAYKKGISILGGVIEHTYRGEYGVIVLNTGEEDFVIKIGDKVAQVVVAPVAAVEVEEVGELSRELNNLYGTKKKKSSEAKKELADELIDVIFTIICIANDEKINLEKAWQNMVTNKMQKRDINRFKRKNES